MFQLETKTSHSLRRRIPVGKMETCFQANIINCPTLKSSLSGSVLVQVMEYLRKNPALAKESYAQAQQIMQVLKFPKT